MGIFAAYNELLSTMITTDYEMVFYVQRTSIYDYEKKVLKSDGHQFHQYQQNEQPPLKSLYTKKTMICDFGIPGPGFGQMARLNRIMLSRWLFRFERRQDKNI